MILEPHAAAQFIQGYKTLLLEIDAEVSENRARRVLEKLVAAREQLCKDRSLLKKGLDRVKARAFDISPEQSILGRTIVKATAARIVHLKHKGASMLRTRPNKRIEADRRKRASPACSAAHARR